jgi:hypothetical protein
MTESSNIEWTIFAAEQAFRDVKVEIYPKRRQIPVVVKEKVPSHRVPVPGFVRQSACFSVAEALGWADTLVFCQARQSEYDSYQTCRSAKNIPLYRGTRIAGRQKYYIAPKK